MKKWTVKFLPEAVEDIRNLDGSQRLLVRKMIDRVSENPLPNSEGGYGKPLGHKGGNNLAGLFKIKLKKSGLRVVYLIEKTEEEMVIVVVGARTDDAVYEIAGKRIATK